MRRSPSIAVALSVLLVSGLTGQEASSSEPLAFTHVTVVDVRDGDLHADRTVLVRDGRIASVEPAAEVSVPDGARVIDATGKFMIPGLWDMHVHAARAGRAPRFWPLLVAHGVTGVREMGSHLDSLLHWRDESEKVDARSPRIHWSSPMLDGSPPVLPMGMAVPDGEAARAAVDSMRKLGFDFLKIYERLSGETYSALAREARKRGIAFAGHVPLGVDPREASDAGQRSLEHATDVATACIPEGRALFRAAGGVGGSPGTESQETARRSMEKLMGTMAFVGPEPALCEPFLSRMATNGTWFTPTLTQSMGRLVPSSYDGDARLRTVPPEVASMWRRSRGLGPEQEARIGQPILDNMLRLVGMAHRAGVGILAGTDASDEPYIFAGSSLHDELGLLVGAGLSPLEALQAATLEPARYLEATDSHGTVERGRMADLVLLDADPLDDIRNTRSIHGVVLKGRYLDREALDRLLADAGAPPGP